MYNRVRMPHPAHFSNILENLFSDYNHYADARTHGASVNIRENGEQYEMQLVAPGLKKEDFQINVDKNTLTISFEQKEETQEKDEKWLRQEFRMKSFKRSFTLNDKIDVQAINATYDNGILRVSLPKKEKEEPKSLSISVQ